ncbi:MAG: hypothetical protein HY748_17085 [Elusimicrobia bacterium]|nr:hypothetical protein [Elusimicrobiota bacterium]
MEAQQDFKELLELFNAHAVEYLIVGAHALAFHGAPRYTGDMDVYVCSAAENARRVMAALRDFGFGSTGLSESDFSEPDKVVQLGHPPVRIDLMTSLSGLSWDEAFAHRMAGEYGDVPVSFIGREQFVANKRACGRKKDLADIEALGG